MISVPQKVLDIGKKKSIQVLPLLFFILYLRQSHPKFQNSKAKNQGRFILIKQCLPHVKP